MEGWAFLWSNGVTTDGPVLRDVPCGVYAAVPMPRGGEVPMLIHACDAARVTAAPLTEAFQ